MVVVRSPPDRLLHLRSGLPDLPRGDLLERLHRMLADRALILGRYTVPCTPAVLANRQGLA